MSRHYSTNTSSLSLYRWITVLLGVFSFGLLSWPRRIHLQDGSYAWLPISTDHKTYSHTFHTTAALSAFTYHQTGSLSASLLSAILSELPRATAQTGYYIKSYTPINGLIARHGMIVRPNNNFIAFTTAPIPASNIKIVMCEFSSNGTLLQAYSLGPSSGSINLVYSSFPTSFMQATATSDGGFAVGGTTTSYGTTQNTVILAKWGDDTSIQWLNMYEGTRIVGTGRAIASMTTTNDGNMMAVVRGNGLELLKIANDGTFLEGSYLKTNVSDGFLSPGFIKMLANGDYIILGATRAGGQDTNLDGFLLRMTAAGQISWAGVIGLKGEYEELRAATVTTDNGIVALGVSQGLGVTSQGFLLAKWSSNGILEWTKGFDSAFQGYSVITTPPPNDGIVIAVSRGSSESGFAIGKFLNNGAFVWGYILTGSPGSSTYAYNLAINDAGDLHVLAQISSGGTIVVAKLNSNGTLYGCLPLTATTEASWKINNVNATFSSVGIITTSAPFIATPVLSVSQYADVRMNFTEKTPICRDTAPPTPVPMMSMTLSTTAATKTNVPSTSTTATSASTVSTLVTTTVGGTDITTPTTKASTTIFFANTSQLSASTTSTVSKSQILPTSTHDATTTETDKASTSKDADQTTIIAIAAGVSAVVFLSFLTGLVIFFRNRSQKKNSVRPSTMELEDVEHARDTFKDLELSMKKIVRGKELGRGGFGVVLKANWNGKVVAIKQLTTTNFSEKLEQDFLQEIALMARLRSPKIVRLWGVCTDEKPYVLVMEYMEGGSLFTLIHSGRTLEWNTKLSIMLDVAYGLEYLHGKNVIHRDIKSPNILLTRDNKAKLSDFGLSTVTNTLQQSTPQTNTVGSICWMAPELFEGVPHSEKSDIYSYGVVGWEIESQKIPYADAMGNEPLIKEWIKKGKTEPRPERTPDDFWEIILQCWQKAPQQRPSAKEVIKKFTASKDPLLSSALISLGSFSVTHAKNNLNSRTVDSDDADTVVRRTAKQ